METNIFDYDLYKTYLKERLNNPNLGGWGIKTKLAHALNCQTSYIAQVLNGPAHLSMEQAEAANSFFGHTEHEGDFFILILLHERAGTPVLKHRLMKQIRAIREGRLNLKQRLGVGQSLTAENQARYYSTWYYAAIQALFTIPEFSKSNNRGKIAEKLGISLKLVNDAIEFLIQAGLVRQTKTGFELTETRSHLGADSPYISKHHINWRFLAARALEQSRSENLHYSSVITLSKKDYSRIRELLVQTITQAKAVVRESDPEGLFVFSLDLFEIDQ